MDKFDRPDPLDAGLGAKLIETALFPEFSQLLLDAAASRGQVQEVFAFVLRDGSAPEALVSASANSGYEQRVEQYIKRFFYHDPLIQQRQNIKEGSGFAFSVGSQEIGPYDYRELCFDGPQYKEKLCFGWKGKERLLVLNFYRSTLDTDNDAGNRLAGLADLALAALHRKLAISPEKLSSGLIRKRLRLYFPQLTPRETDVCGMTLAGKSARNIGQELGISPNSVLTYRQRAYGRIGIGSAHELLPRLII